MANVISNGSRAGLESNYTYNVMIIICSAASSLADKPFPY